MPTFTSEIKIVCCLHVNAEHRKNWLLKYNFDMQNLSYNYNQDY